jgi:hypothetical protein
VREDGGLISALAIAVRETASQDHPGRQRGEVVVGYEHADHGPPVTRHQLNVLRDHVVEQIPPISDRLVVTPSEGLTPCGLRAPRDAVQGLGTADGVRLQKVRIEHGERNGHNREADGERDDGGQQEGRTLPQHANGIPHVLQQLFKGEPEATPMKLRRSAWTLS